MSYNKPAQLSKEDIQNIYDWAEALPEIVAVRLFGGYAKRTATERGDVDLAVSIRAEANDTPLSVLIENASIWNRHLSQKLGKRVRIEEYPGEVAAYCVDASILIYP